MQYRRTVSPRLLAELAGGSLAWLPKLVQQQPVPGLLDLQLRDNPGRPTTQVTLYYGALKALTIEDLGILGAELVSDELHQNDGVVEWLAKALKPEGTVQARFCSQLRPNLAVLDREAQISHARDVVAQLRGEIGPVMDSLYLVKRKAGVQFPKPKPMMLGGEADAVAIDRAGRLLVIEIKPDGPTPTATWAPAQATLYASLFSRWAATPGIDARGDLLAMLAQRVALGLANDLPLADPLEIVPVVVLERPIKSPVLLGRMNEVHQALLNGGVGWENLEIWGMSACGAIDRLGPDLPA